MLAAAESAAHHLDTDAFLGTITNESNWVIAPKPSDEGTTFGMCQYHNLKDWGMTRAQAEDPYYCLDRMATYWEKYGEKGARRWSGYIKYKKFNR